MSRTQTHAPLTNPHMNLSDNYNNLSRPFMPLSVSDVMFSTAHSVLTFTDVNLSPTLVPLTNNLNATPQILLPKQAYLVIH